MIDTPTLPTIESTRLRLRWLTRDDVGSLYGIFSNHEVMRYWSRTPLVDTAEAEALLDSIEAGFQSHTLYQWGIVSRENDHVIGTCTLYELDFANRRAGIGYALGRDHWRQGVAQEALNTLFEYAFGSMQLHRIEADVDPRNDASIRLLERLGFQREGYLRERWQVGGEVQDSLLFGLLEQDWRARNPGAEPGPLLGRNRL